MDTKLTLKLDNKVISKAKKYARSKNMSLSKMIEKYLEQLLSTEDKEDEDGITPLVRSIGSIGGKVKLPKNFNFRKEYTAYLEKKYK
ncbi:MAG TPA: DUF6364 family protein [Bacteroidia bacterium]|jgi:hypothetical protein|nr:DUF6364 family protein [Bacteroidia bacterium]